MWIACLDCRRNEVVNPGGMARDVSVVGMRVLLIYVERILRCLNDQ